MKDRCQGQQVFVPRTDISEIKPKSLMLTDDRCLSFLKSRSLLSSFNKHVTLDLD